MPDKSLATGGVVPLRAGRLRERMGSDMMTYEQAMERINSLLRFGVKPGLERIRLLLSRLGNPQDSLRFVHVAGTNGKGTTCALVSSVLRQAGYRTGLYTSPYVTEFRERFQIDGEMIPKEELVALVEHIVPIAEEISQAGEPVTEFELVTAIALVWFAQRRCDVVVLEVGLGGRFDATNIIAAPLVAVIASISLDHTAVLGDTLEQIAFEKCGIIKQGGDVVLYPDQAAGVIETVRRIAQERGARLWIPELDELREERADIHGTDFSYRGIRLHIPFLGEHQEKNAATALTALQVLRQKGFALSDEAVQKGFAQAVLPARMEVLGEKPLVLLDGGHNPGCAEALAQALERFLPGVPITAVMGLMRDKDSNTALHRLAPCFTRILTVQPNNPRALSAQELAEVARRYCPQVQAMPSVEDACRQALLEARHEKGAVVVCGSFYLAGEARPVLMALC